MQLKEFKGNKRVLVILALIWMVSCTERQKEVNSDQSSTTDKVTQIVDRSIRKHGGWDMWQRVEKVAYKKRIILYDSLANVESDLVQHHFYDLSQERAGSISWIYKEDITEINFEGYIASKKLNVTNIETDEARVSAINIVNSSFFVLFQPFKLLDPETRLDYLGIDTLKNGKVVNVVSPGYGEPEEGNDKWLFYFDLVTDELVANSVNHLGRLSFIENLSFDSTSKLVLHKHRKSYIVDSQNNVKYLRAEYFYGDYDIQFRE